jgi:hypothetical protein
MPPSFHTVQKWTLLYSASRPAIMSQVLGAAALTGH